MAFIDDVKSELAELEDEKVDARKAQVTTMIRFAGGFMNNAQKQIVMLATFDSLIAAQWLKNNIEELYNLEAHLATSTRTTPKGTHQYHVVKVERGAVNLARRHRSYRPQQGRPRTAGKNRAGQDRPGACRMAWCLHGQRNPLRSRQESLYGDHLPQQ